MNLLTANDEEVTIPGLNAAYSQKLTPHGVERLDYSAGRHPNSMSRESESSGNQTKFRAACFWLVTLWGLTLLRRAPVEPAGQKRWTHQ